MGDAFQTIIKSGSLIFFGLIIAKILGYATRVFLARTFSPEGYGLIFLGVSIFTLLSAFHILGLYRAIQRYVAYFRGRGESGKIKGIIISSFKISLLASIILTFILFFSADWISQTWFTPELAPILRIFSLMFPFLSILTISNFSCIGFKKIKYEVYTQRIGKAAVTFLFIVFLTFLGFGVTGGALSYLFATVVAAVLAFYFLERRVFPIIKSRVKSVPMTRELLIFSAPVFFAEIMDTLTRTISTIMLGSLTTTTEAGIYQVAYPTSELVMVIPFALTSLFVPIIAGLYSRGKTGEIKNIYKTLSKWVFYTTLPFIVFFFIFSEAFVGILFGSEYLAASLPLGILAIGFTAFAFSELPAGIIDMLKKTKLHSINAVVVGITCITLNYIFILEYGIIGAAAATAASFVLLALLRAVEAYHQFRIYPPYINMLKASLAAIISGGFIFSISMFFPGIPIHTVVCLGVLFFVLYALLILVFRGLDKTDTVVLDYFEAKTGVKLKLLKRVLNRFV